MRTTVTLDDDVYEAVEALSKSTGKRLGEVLSELVRRAIRDSSATQRSQTGLPVFSVRADAAVIPSSRASELLSDEG